MPAVPDFMLTLTRCVRVLFVLGLFGSLLPAQTSVNDVHIVPREVVPMQVGSTASLKVVNGSFLHVIKSDVSLVLVPVSVMDGAQRLVKGLGQDNFQVFE